MKLAEALQERADLNTRIAQLRNRLQLNALVQEGEQPAEQPQALLEELDQALNQLEALICRINQTNCQTLSEGETLTALLARRDCLTLRLQALRAFVEEAGAATRRATRTEIRILSTVNIREQQQAIDALAKELRLLENRIQQTNWTAELL